ncbi:MAG: hypothetical protein MUD08_19045 [Cytophagales bacterium]|jgi:hypothetical protein|nr:hypothetical protein [Cytophagales bacterium]
MKSIAKALVYAVTYINLRNEESTEDDDVAAIESITDFLSTCTDEEKAMLKNAVQELLNEELANNKRSSYTDDYQTWMEDMFVSEEDYSYFMLIIRRLAQPSRRVGMATIARPLAGTRPAKPQENSNNALIFSELREKETCLLTSVSGQRPDDSRHSPETSG